MRPRTKTLPAHFRLSPPATIPPPISLHVLPPSPVRSEARASEDPATQSLPAHAFRSELSPASSENALKVDTPSPRARRSGSVGSRLRPLTVHLENLASSPRLRPFRKKSSTSNTSPEVLSRKRTSTGEPRPFSFHLEDLSSSPRTKNFRQESIPFSDLPSQDDLNKHGAKINVGKLLMSSLSFGKGKSSPCVKTKAKQDAAPQTPPYLISSVTCAHDDSNDAASTGALSPPANVNDLTGRMGVRRLSSSPKMTRRGILERSLSSEDADGPEVSFQSRFQSFDSEISLPESGVFEGSIRSTRSAHNLASVMEAEGTTASEVASPTQLSFSVSVDDDDKLSETSPDSSHIPVQRKPASIVRESSLLYPRRESYALMSRSSSDDNVARLGRASRGGEEPDGIRRTSKAPSPLFLQDTKDPLLNQVAMQCHLATDTPFFA